MAGEQVADIDEVATREVAGCLKISELELARSSQGFRHDA